MTSALLIITAKCLLPSLEDLDLTFNNEVLSRHLKEKHNMPVWLIDSM